MQQDIEELKAVMRHAYFVSELSTCLRRKVGAILFNPSNNNRYVGYNGAPECIPACVGCLRLGMKSGEKLDFCYAVHAEVRAILCCHMNNIHDLSEPGWILVVTHKPCSSCMRIIAEVGIKTVIYGKDYGDGFPNIIAHRAGIKLIYLPELLGRLK